MEPEVSVKGLGYRYRGQQKPALDGVDLEVAEGEFVVVMGPSGAGKSTLCVSLNGLIPHFFRGKMEGEVRLEGFENRTPATLSGGQKQRLAIASVLAIEPRILCLDEPTTDLDPIGKLGIFEIAEDLKDRDDVTLIVVEHETEETLDADRIIVLREGKIVADRPAREVLRDVELLQESSVMPLQVTRFFHEMGLWQGQLPLTP